MSKMKNYLKYICLFIFFFLCLTIIFTINKGDTYVNFGFSYAISKGEIPYNDFNMVITPFAPFLYSIGLLFSKSIIIYFLEQALLLTLLFYILSRLLKNKSMLFLLCMIIPYPIAFSTCLFPGYNFLLFLLFLLLVYLEKTKRNDYLIGFVIGLIFCTKQTIGLVLVIPWIYFLFKNQKIFFKRIIGYFIPIGVLFVYLIISNSLNNFIDLCFLGLFNFGNGNSSIDIFYLILLIIGVLIILWKIVKDKKNITLYYGLLFSAVSLPIIDYYHVSLFLLVVVFFVLLDLKFEFNLNKYCVLVIGCICLLWLFVTKSYFDEMVLVNYNNFEFTLIDKKYHDDSIKLNRYINSLDKKTIYLLRGSENYFYKIINNKKIDYYDLPNRGNYGFSKEIKVLSSLAEVEDCYFVVDRELLNNKDSNQQYIKSIGLSVTKYKLVKSIGVYDIYYKE